MSDPDVIEYLKRAEQRLRYRVTELAPHVYLALDEASQHGYLSLVKHEEGWDATARWLFAKVNFDKGRERDATALEKYGEKYWREYADEPSEIVEQARPAAWVVESFMYPPVPTRPFSAPTLEEAIQGWLEHYQKWASRITQDAALLAQASVRRTP